MTRPWRSLYGKISAVFLLLLATLGAVHTYVALRSAMQFVSESEQKLNVNLARDLVKEFRPFLKDSIDYANIEHTMHYMMVMNPRVEIYLLDGGGRILAFFAEPGKTVQRTHVNLSPIHRFLSNHDNMPIMGDDPRHASRQKTFSAAPLKIGREVDGYLYVILGGEQYDSATKMVKESYIMRSTSMSFLVVVGFTGLLGLVMFALLIRRFHKMTAVVRQFAAGNYEDRIAITSQDEIGRLASAFNQMADTIVANMQELKRSDTLRRELVANVSHDLRSPLASMQGYLETVLIKDETLLPAERRRYLQIILDNTQMLGKLVSELFELSKLDAQQVQPLFEPFVLAELVQDVVMKFKPQAERSKINLQASFPPELPQVYADLGLIERALSNLIDNALRYTPEAGRVQVQLSRGGNGNVTVRVVDTGSGIPPEDLPNIFERFYRVEKSRGRAAGGAGLGLAIAKRILELHGSRLVVHSAVNAGTTISFDLKTTSISSSR
ncbi:MAG: ATP-binding protein [bacterium]